MAALNRQTKPDSQTDILKLPYLVLIVAMLLTIGATYIFYQNEQSKDFVRFRAEVERCKNRLDGKIGAYIGLLKAGRGFVESNRHLTRESFSNFVNSLEIEKNYPEINRLGFSKETEFAERGALSEKMEAEGFEDFKIFPHTTNKQSQPTIYIEPASKENLSIIGFDLLAEPVFKAAIEDARARGETTATEKIGESKNSSFAIFMPIYKAGKRPATAADRITLSEGFIYDLIDADAFLRDAQKSAGVSDMAVTIYENSVKPENIVAQTDLQDSPPGNSQLTATTEFKVADKKWIASYQTLPAFNTQSGINWTPIIFMIGVVFSLLLFIVTYLESHARAKAEKMMGELQESEREKGFLLEREQKARRATEASSRVKDEFISIVSHELRTPLNSIAGWSKILQTERLPENIKNKALQTIDKNVRVQTRIVEDLLDFSQILSGSPNLTKEEIDLSSIFENAYHEARSLADEKNISLIKENELVGQNIFGDSEKLKKVLKNLFFNAVKFTPEGGEVYAELKKNDGKVEIKIKDTGQGIAPEFMPRLFENFRQADSSSTRTHGGLGLGLAITRRIIELHGGKIFAASEGLNKGTVFTIQLPAKVS